MKLFIIAGETSGDKHGALLMQELLRQDPSMEIMGLGGPLMQAVSPEIEDWVEEAAVIGVVEVLKKYGWFRQKFLDVLDRIKREQPDGVILVDYPGFNLRMAERLRRDGVDVRIGYFISPQVWAWHKGRIPKMAKILDLMMCIFPFEKPLFEGAGLWTEFVGHPLVDDILAERQTDVREPKLVGLFPGSRVREIERHFPVFIQVVDLLRHRHPDWVFETAASNTKLADLMRRMAHEFGLPANVLHIRTENYHGLMDRANAALVASGTATLEAALHELPYALVYKVAWGTYLAAKLLVRIPHIGMVNILSGKEVVRELVQNDFSVENCIAELERLMDEEQREGVVRGMRAATDLLGHGGAAAKAAAAVMKMLKGQQGE